MTYLQSYTLALDADFIHRVQIGVSVGAQAIAGEAQGSFSTTRHAKRQSLARQIILSLPSAQYTDRFTWLVVADTTVAAGITDSALQDRIFTVWDDAAGVDATEL